jgi:hypothetical protein
MIITIITINLSFKLIYKIEKEINKKKKKKKNKNNR